MKIKAWSLLLLCALSLTSCSIFSSSTSTSIRLPEQFLTANQPLKIDLIGSGPFVYRISPAQSAGPSEFLTVLSDCSKAHRKLSAEATTRQLLVGLRNLVRLRQEHQEIGGRNVASSYLTADLDNIPLALSCHTFRSGSCTIDAVTWHRADSAQAPADAAPPINLAPLFELYSK